MDIIVVQGQEAGGHGMDRGLMSLLPAVRELAGEQQILLAAGGIARGSGLAAALMLGADGVMLGTRFWASAEASGSAAAKAQLVAKGGDQTLRTKVFDVARGVDWPWQFSGRVVANEFATKWHSHINQHRQAPEAARVDYEASAADDYTTRVVIAGEALDHIDSIEPAAKIIEQLMEEAVELLTQTHRYALLK